jgi:hypothetical protein
MSRAAVVALATAAFAAAAAGEPAFERAVRLDGPGRVAVRLDRDVYESARPDLGDVRVLDESGRLVPFVLDRGEAAGRRPERRPALRNRGRTADGASTVDLDFGSAAGPSRLALRLSGDNFRRAVSVAGSRDGREWTTLVEQAWVFAVPGKDAARYETVDLPATDFSLFRVRVRGGPDERDKIAIEDAWAPADERRPLHEETITPRLARAEAPGGETWLTLDLGAAHQPFHAVELDVADPRFFREAVVEARRDRPGRDGRPPTVAWVEVGRGALYRLGTAPRASECLSVPVSGRERALRLRLLNRDDRPLDVRGVRVRVPVERVVFEAVAPRTYRIVYGSSAAAPEFDLARTVGDVPAWAAGAREATLGPPRRSATAPGGAAPWTERHPALLWAGLVAVVVALGALTWRAVRSS